MIRYIKIASILPVVALMLPIWAFAFDDTTVWTSGVFQASNVGNTAGILVMSGTNGTILFSFYQNGNPTLVCNVGGAAILDPNAAYDFLSNPTCYSTSFSTGDLLQVTDGHGNSGFFYILKEGGVAYWNGSVDAANNTTRLVSTTPVNGSTIATSSSATFGATGYIGSEDFVSGAYIDITYIRDADLQTAVACTDCLYTHLSLPVTTSGSFNVSTTSSALGGGHYTVQTSIRTPTLVGGLLNFFGFGQFATQGVLSATSTGFYAHAPNQVDLFIASTTQSINDYIASSTVSLASCTSWVSFSIANCLNLMFLPQTKPIMDSLTNFKNNFLSYAPWGYVTRTVVILTNNATTTALPTFVVTPFIASGDMQTLTYNMQDMLTGGASALEGIHDPITDKSPRDIIEPWIRLLVAVSVMFTIIKDVAGMAIHAGGGGRKTKLA